MRIVKTSLSSAQIDDLSAAPGQTDSDRLRWLVGFWGQTLDAHRARIKAEEDAALKAPRLELLKGAADEAIRDMSTGEDASAPNVVASVLASECGARQSDGGTP